MKSKTAREAFTKLHMNVFTKSGVPQLFMLQDDDPAWKSDIAKEWAAITQTRMPRTAPYSHWQLGRLENRHKIFNRLLQALPLREKNRWPYALVLAATSAINFTPSTITKLTPFQIHNMLSNPAVLGRNPISKQAAREAIERLGFSMGDPIDDESKLFSRATTLKLAQELFVTAVRYRANSIRQQNIDRKNAQAHRSPTDFKPGTKVRVYRPTRKKKSRPQWQANWTIREKVGSASYRVQNDSTRQTITISKGQIRPMPSVPVDAPNEIRALSQPIPDSKREIKSDSEYKVGEIIAVVWDEFMASNEFWFAKILGQTEDGWRIQFFASKKKKPDLHSVFRPAWQDARDNGLYLQVRRPNYSSVSAWTGTLTNQKVIARNLSLTSAGKLQSTSRQLIKDYSSSMVPAPLPCFEQSSQEVMLIDSMGNEEMESIPVLRRVDRLQKLQLPLDMIL